MALVGDQSSGATCKTPKSAKKLAWAKVVFAPSDSDRARFGFLKHFKEMRRLKPYRYSDFAARTSRSLERSPPLSALLEHINHQPEAQKMPVEIVSLLQAILGDPDADLPVLRTRLNTRKYDFKGRIAELMEQNKALRGALSEKRDGHKMLAEVLAHMQAGRTAIAEKCASEREEEFSALRHEAQESRDTARKAQNKALRATELVKEAGMLLSQQLDDGNMRQRVILDLTMKREATLASQLEKAEQRETKLVFKLATAEAKMVDLEARLAAIARPREPSKDHQSCEADFFGAQASSAPAGGA